MKIAVGWVAVVQVALGLALGGACSKDAALAPASLEQSNVSAPTSSRPIRLEIENREPVQLLFSERGTIRLKAVFADDNTEAANQVISFALEGNVGGSRLDASRVTTGIDGRAENILSAGTERATFQLVVGNELALNSLTSDVSVDGRYRGALRARFAYAGAVNLQRVTARVHRGNFACQGEEYLAAAPVLSEKSGQGVAPVVFELLDENHVYSVSVNGFGPRGNAVAAGCAVASPIIGRGTVDVTVPLKLAPAQINGVYDFATPLPLHEGLPPPVASAVEFLDDVFQNPGATLRREIIKVLAGGNAAMGGVIEAGFDFAAAAAFAGNSNADRNRDGRVTFQEAFDYVFFGLTPAWVSDGVRISSDVTELLTNLTVGGVLEIDDSDMEAGTFEGRWYWNDFLLRWRYGQDCDVTASCCGLVEYTGEEMGLTPVASPFDGTFTERLTTGSIGYDVQINPHRVALQYGNIANFAIKDIVLKSLTGQNTIAGAVESLLGCTTVGGQRYCGCARLGQWLQTTFGSQLGQRLGGDVCRIALAGIEQVVTNELNKLAFDGVDGGHVEARVTASLTDGDYDLQTDTWLGETLGKLTIASYNTGFSGELRGATARTDCTSASDCLAGQVCETVPAVLNACIDRSVCSVSD